MKEPKRKKPCANCKKKGRPQKPPIRMKRKKTDDRLWDYTYMS